MLILSLIFGCEDHEFTGGGHHSGGETTGEGYAAVQSYFFQQLRTVMLQVQHFHHWMVIFVRTW